MKLLKNNLPKKGVIFSLVAVCLISLLSPIIIEINTQIVNYISGRRIDLFPYGVALQVFLWLGYCIEGWLFWIITAIMMGRYLGKILIRQRSRLIVTIISLGFGLFVGVVGYLFLTVPFYVIEKVKWEFDLSFVGIIFCYIVAYFFIGSSLYKHNLCSK